MRDPLTVLHLDAQPGWRGGQRQVLELTTRLVQRGYRCLVGCPAGSGLAERLAARGIEALPLTVRGDLDLLGIPSLVCRVRGRRPQLVHSHSARSLVAGSVTARLLGTPHVHSRRVDFPVKTNPFSRYKYRRGADLYLAVSREVGKILQAGGTPPERIRVVRSGVDPDSIRSGTPGLLRRELGIPADVPVLGTAGHLAPHKGHQILLRAAVRVLSTHPEAHFLLAGEGEERPALESLLRQESLDQRVHLLGYRSDLGDFLAALDLFVMPSLTEGLGTAILDAMCRELPVIGSRVGGIPEILQSGETGLLVPPGEPEALAEAIRQLLDDPELRRAMGRAGGLRVQREFHIDQTVQETEEAYRELLVPQEAGR